MLIVAWELNTCPLPLSRSVFLILKVKLQAFLVDELLHFKEVEKLLKVVDFCGAHHTEYNPGKSSSSIINSRHTYIFELPRIHEAFCIECS